MYIKADEAELNKADKSTQRNNIHTTISYKAALFFSHLQKKDLTIETVHKVKHYKTRSCMIYINTFPENYTNEV
jgi:hypothetical protein